MHNDHVGNDKQHNGDYVAHIDVSDDDNADNDDDKCVHANKMTATTATAGADTALHRLIVMWRHACRRAADTRNNNNDDDDDASMCTLCVGAIVFAPYKTTWSTSGVTSLSRSAATHATRHGRRSWQQPQQQQQQQRQAQQQQQTRQHYALAEVTGVQRCAATVSVSFVFADVGVDDVAVSMYDVVPCPLWWLQQQQLLQYNNNNNNNNNNGNNNSCRLSSSSLASSSCCSLLERLAGVTADAPAMTTAALCARQRQRRRHDDDSGGNAVCGDVVCLSDATNDDDSDSDYGGGDTNMTRHNTIAASTSSSSCSSSSSDDDCDDSSHDASKHKQQQQQSSLSSLARACAYERAMSESSYFARVFAALHAHMSCAHASSPSLSLSTCMRHTRAVLCVFDSYRVLHRFDVYASVRGHRVLLLDGSVRSDDDESDDDDETSSNDDSDDSDDTTCRLHYGCMLIHDAQTAAADGTMPLLLRGLTSSSHVRVCARVHMREHDDDEEHNDNNNDAVAAALRVVDAALPYCTQHLTLDLAQLPTYTAAAATTTTRRVTSSSVFANRKLLVPASREQLLLLHTILQQQEQEQHHQQLPLRHVAAGTRDSAPCATSRALPPTLLERVALGTLSDAALHTLWRAHGDDVAMQRSALDAHDNDDDDDTTTTTTTMASGSASYFCDVQRIRHAYTSSRGYECSDDDVSDRFARAFPVYAALRAVLRDVFASALSPRHKQRRQRREEERKRTRAHAQASYARRRHCHLRGDNSSSARLPRIAVVLPTSHIDGNNVASSSSSTATRAKRYAAALRASLAPWRVYTAPPHSATLQRRTTSNNNDDDVVTWLRGGGVLLLCCDDAATALAALHVDADVVIACGRRAAAWVAAHALHDDNNGNDTPTLCFAIVSEVELVADVAAHTWLPTPYDKRSDNDDARMTRADRDALWAQLRAATSRGGDANGVTRPHSSYACVPKVLLQSVLTWRQLRRDTAAGVSWRHVCDMARRLALHLVHVTSPVRLDELHMQRGRAHHATHRV